MIMEKRLLVTGNLQNGKWEFMRERTDKSLPNSSKTAKAVYNSIIYPIDKEILIAFVEKMCLQKQKKRPASQPPADRAEKVPRT